MRIKLHPIVIRIKTIRTSKKYLLTSTNFKIMMLSRKKDLMQKIIERSKIISPLFHFILRHSIFHDQYIFIAIL